MTHAGRSYPAHRCPLCGGYKALRRDAATGHEKSAGRDAERSDRPQDQAAPRKADPPAAYEAQHRVSNIEITDQNIRAFSATAKKYGIDFALKKDTSGEIPRYLVFFKGRDADVITEAFREFSAKNLEKEKKPSIRKELDQAKQQAKAQHRQREKVKAKDRGVEL